MLPKVARTPSPWFVSSAGCSWLARSESVFDVEVADAHEGFIALRVTGDFAWNAFQHDAGGHRWQRVAPNDKRGRVHTSTVTVAVLMEPTAKELVINPGDLDWAFSRGSGAGGQHRNKTESAVDLTHRPTGVVVHCESDRSQKQNKANALTMLRSRLWEAQREQEHAVRSKDRRGQIGTGMRGDKVVTVRVQDGIVTWHILGQKQPLKSYLSGETPA